MFSLEFVIRIKIIISDSCVTKTCMCMLRGTDAASYMNLKKGESLSRGDKMDYILNESM